MGFFPCAGKPSIEKQSKKTKNERDNHLPQKSPGSEISSLKCNTENSKAMSESPFSDKLTNDDACSSPFENDRTNGSKVRTFTYAELVAATDNFNDDYFLGEGGFGKVYKGHLQNSGQIVAIKQLDRDGSQGIKEFKVEVSTLGNAEHTNLVKLIGYCIENDQSCLLVYEYMPLGSLEGHLHGKSNYARQIKNFSIRWSCFCYAGSLHKRKALDWNRRMKIVAGAAMGLEYLHHKMNPPVIYRDLKCSNILLDEDYHPKLSDFGLAKEGPSGGRTHVSTRVMGTYGYCAPDYAMTGQLNFKSDIYSFGVVLLEMITGKRAIDDSRTGPEQNLVEWAKPMFKDRKKFQYMVDQALEGRYPVRGLYQIIAISAMCIQEQPRLRPPISDVVKALDFLASQKYDPTIHPVHGLRISN